MELVAATSAEMVAVAGQRFTVQEPRWLPWQSALDKAGGPLGQVDAQRLIEECLQVCLLDEPGRPMSRQAVQRLNAADGDRLLAMALELIERRRQRLNLQVEPRAEGSLLTGSGVNLLLRAWSFGERNRALCQALQLDGEGHVTVDLAAYERQMVLTSVREASGGQTLAVATVMDWPVALGEAVVAELDRLNGLDPDYERVLAASLRTGQSHPDLALAQLCQTFGWTPDQVEALDARLAERLLAVLRQVPSAVVAPAGAPGPALPPERALGLFAAGTGGEGVTRILVDDD